MKRTVIEMKLAMYGVQDVTPESGTVVSRLRQTFAQEAMAPALLTTNREVTFGDLGDRVRLAAAGLRRLGVGPGHLVGVHVERSVDQLIAVLAVLDSGAAYVPLDPSYPAERLRIYARAAALRTVIRGTDSAEHLLSGPGRLVTVAELVSSGQEADDGAWGAEPDPDSLAYVYFTSGSTGVPKGIKVLHRNVDFFVGSFHEAAVLPLEQDVPQWLNLTSVSFDPWVVECLLSLSYGHRVVIAPPGTALDVVVSGGLAELLAKCPVTHLQCTPTALSLMLSSLPTRSALAGLHQILVGGEALPVPLAVQARQAWPGVTVTNIYGPTETTVWAFSHHVTDDDLDDRNAAGSAPIGFPLPGVRPSLVPLSGPASDEESAGLAELIIGGPGVAAGYLNPPDGVPSPFTEDGYRTGDLVRDLGSGLLSFAGRADDQVKVRGQRIELGEIESVIAGVAGVRQAVAWVRDEQIVVAVLPEDGQAPPVIDEILQRAGGHLPPAAVPGEVVFVDRLPSTPSGKADRRALAAHHPVALPAQPGQATQVAPLSAQDLVSFFVEILPQDQTGSPAIDPDSDFFAHGGTSVLAVRLLGRVLQRTGVRLGLAELVYAPTPRALAERLRSASTGNSAAGLARAAACLVPIKAGASAEKTFFCVHGIGGNVVNLIPMGRSFPEPWDFIAVQARGVDGQEPPDSSVDQMAGRYAVAIRSQQPTGPYVIGGYSDGGLIALATARLLAESGAEIGAVVLFDSEPRQPGGRTVKRRLRHAWSNAREHGLPVLTRGAAQAMTRRFSPARREADRDLGYGDAEVFGYVDLSDPIGRALDEYPMAATTMPIVLIHAIDRRPGDQPISAWDPYLKGRMIIRDTPGDHLNMLDQERAPALSQLVINAVNDILASKSATGAN